MVKKHILFILENNPFPQDVRVRNEALAAIEFGYDVSVICPKNKKTQEKYENLEGIDVYRHNMPLEADSKFGFLFEYANALLWETYLSFKIFFRQRFHIIHSANPPDHVFIIALFFKIFGVRYIFDHHDICPENYLAKFQRKDLLYKLLIVMEKMTFMTADAVVSTNESYKRIAITRGKKDSNQVFVVRNGPNLNKVIFKKANNIWKEGFDFLVVYIGNIGNQEGIENLLEAVRYIVYDINIRNIKFIVIGKGPHLENLKVEAEKMQISEYAHFTGYISYEDFYEILATADIGVNPEHRNKFTDQSTMLKIMDYMTFGKPTVMFETTEGKVSAGEAALYLSQNDNVQFAESIVGLLNDKDRRTRMGEIARKRITEKLNWDIQKQNLKRAYESVWN